MNGRKENVSIKSDELKCGFSLKNSSLKTLVVLSAIFVADTKIIFRYDFVAPLTSKIVLN